VTVPVDLREPVVFGLQMFIRVLEESSEKQLRAIGHYLPHQDAQKANYFMLSNARFKLCRHLMNPMIDRPSETLPYFEAAIEADRRRTGKSNRAPWLLNPMLWIQYSEALTLAGVFTEETKVALEHALEVVDSPSAKEAAFANADNLSVSMVTTRIHLANVLLRLGKNSDSQRE